MGSAMLGSLALQTVTQMQCTPMQMYSSAICSPSMTIRRFSLRVFCLGHYLSLGNTHTTTFTNIRFYRESSILLRRFSEYANYRAFVVASRQHTYLEKESVFL